MIYSVEPALFTADPFLEVRWDSAYWVSGMRARDDVSLPGDKARVDVKSLARADREPAHTPVASSAQNFTQGADLCGPNPEVHTGDGWDVMGLDRSAGPPQAVSNGLQATLARTASLTLDLPRMQLRTDRPLALDLLGDGPTELRLAGPWSGPVLVTRDGVASGSLSPQDGARRTRAASRPPSPTASATPASAAR